MSKFPIKWHEEGIKCSELSLARYESDLSDMQARIDRLKEGITLMRAQLEEAKQQGLDSYDPERFMVKRKPKSQT